MIHNHNSSIGAKSVKDSPSLPSKKEPELQPDVLSVEQVALDVRRIIDEPSQLPEPRNPVPAVSSNPSGYLPFFGKISGLIAAIKAKFTSAEQPLSNEEVAKIAYKAAIAAKLDVQPSDVADGPARAKFLKSILEKNRRTKKDFENCTWAIKLAPIWIEDEAERLEILKYAAKEYPSDINSKVLASYKIKDPKQLVEIVKSIIKRGNFIYKETSFKKMGILDSKDRFAIAMSAVKKWSLTLSTDIKYFEIEDEADRLSVAVVACEETFSRVAQDLKNYDLKESSVIQLVKNQILRGRSAIISDIPKLGIRNQKELVELLKLAAEKGGGEVSHFIKDFKIKEEADRISIAKAVAHANGLAVSHGIENYEISSESERIAIAMIAIDPTEDGGVQIGPSRNIDEYHIKDQKALAALAKRAAAANGEEVARFIEKYGLQNPDDIREVAGLAVQEAGAHVLSYFKRFAFFTHEDFFRLAKLGAGANGEKTSNWIGIEAWFSDEERIEIAKIAFAQNPSGSAPHVEHYRIQDQALLTELAWSAARHKPGVISNTIGGFHLLDEKVRLEIAKEAVLQPGKLHLEGLENYELSDFSLVREGLGVAHSALLDDISSYIQKLRNPATRAQGSSILTKVLFTAKFANLSPENTEEILKITKAFIKLTSTDQKAALLPKLLELIQNPATLASWKSLVSKAEEGKEAMERIYVSTLLLLPYLNQMTLAEDRASCMKALSNRDLRDGSKLMRLIDGLMRMVNTEGLTDEHKVSCLKDFIFVPKTSLEAVFDSCLSLAQLTAFKRDDLIIQSLTLKRSDVAGSIKKSLQDVFQKVFQLSESSGLLKKFMIAFAQFRDPSAIIRYASKLQGLNDPLVMQTLQRFVIAVCEGTFERDRNSEESNPHIKFLKSEFPKIWQQWLNPLEYKLSSSEVSSEPPSTPLVVLDGLEKVLVDNILIHHHLESLESKCPHLLAYLRNPESINLHLAALDKSQEPYAIFQREFIELLRDVKVTKPEELLPKFEALTLGLATLASGATIQLQEDLDHAISKLKLVLKGPQEDSKKWQVFDTTNASDLLMLGRDVRGSCQDIDGSAGYNKCLLAYLLDGKIRAMVVREKDTFDAGRVVRGKILARSVLRLLWDRAKNRPVLVQEQIYDNPSPQQEQWQKAINEACVEKARSLKCVLLQATATMGERYSGKVESLGGPVPYEYVDSAGGVHANGVYKLEKAIQVADFSSD